VHAHLLLVGCLLGLLFNPEDGGNMFLKNAIELLSYYTAAHSIIVVFILTGLSTSDPSCFAGLKLGTQRMDLGVY
jgi:hypothetical protein